ncbi:MAG TPA: hypothetical protein PKU80_00450 [Candidatus Limiplasma sp.]|nr:hypothetical protein [Candidatus Limiplasma sp.]
MQQALKWMYYNHALIPTTAPHETVDEKPLHQKDFWKSVDSDGHPLLARWTTDYDCHEQTSWWHIVKDTPFDFSDIGYRYRKRVRKGIKNFEVRVIDPTEYAEALYQVEVEAASDYPANCRQKVDHDQFIKSLYERRNGITFAAFSLEDHSLAGYLYDIVHESYIEGLLLKAKPSQKKKEVSSALIYGELEYFAKALTEDMYIMAGERTVYHPPQHQEYLEKTFGFRKAYCRLHIQYRQGVKQMIDCLYPLRGLIRCLSRIKLFYQISAVLKMEEIARQSQDPRPPRPMQGSKEAPYRTMKESNVSCSHSVTA